MNKISYLLVFILLCGINVSCSKDDDNNEQSETSTINKTILVFEPYADNLTTSKLQILMSDIDEMKTAIKNNGSMNGYRVLVYYGSSSFSAVLYELKLQNGTVVNDTLKAFSNITQSDQQHLTTMFNTVKTLSPAKTYTLIIGGHGSGWVQSDVSWGDIPQPSTVTSSAKRSFGAYSREADRIETSTLSSAMTAASFHTDLLLFDCCHMDNIETLYDIHSNSDYAIASAGEQVGYGMPYSNIWNYLTATMSKDNIKSIMNTTLSYYDTGSGLCSQTTSDVNPLSLAAIDCSEIDNIAAAMANLNKKYGECTTDLTDNVQRFDKKYVGVFFDLLDYANYQVSGNTSDSYYKSVETAINSAVINIACRGWYHTIINSWSSSIPSCWPVKTFCGITTSDPSTNTSIVDNKKLTSWWKTTH